MTQVDFNQMTTDNWYIREILYRILCGKYTKCIHLQERKGILEELAEIQNITAANADVNE